MAHVIAGMPSHIPTRFLTRHSVPPGGAEHDFFAAPSYGPQATTTKDKRPLVRHLQNPGGTAHRGILGECALTDALCMPSKPLQRIQAETLKDSVQGGVETSEAPIAALRQRHRDWQWQLYSQVQAEAADAAARSGRTNAGLLGDLPASTRVVDRAAPGLFSSLGWPDHIGSLFSDSGLPAERLDEHGRSGMKQTRSATAAMPTPQASSSDGVGVAADGLPALPAAPPARLVKDSYGGDAALVSTLSARPPPLPPQATNTAVYGPLADTLSVRVPAPSIAASSPRPQAPTKAEQHAIEEREPWRLSNDKPSRRGGVRAVLTPPRPSRKRIIAPPSAPLWHAGGGVAAGQWQPCNDANCTAAVLEPSVHEAAPQRQQQLELRAPQPVAPSKEWHGLGRRSSAETGPLLPHQVTTLRLF